MNPEQPQQPQSISNQSTPPPTPKPRIPLLLGGLFVSLLILGGSYYFLANKETTQPEPLLTPSISQPPPTSTPTTDTIANWKTYNISKCLVSFQYPDEWEGNLEDKGNCTIHYTRSPISSEPMDTFIVFDVQPEIFMGKQNIEIDQNKIISKSTVNGIEKTVEYSEEKDISRPIFLANKNYFLKKGQIYFRIIGQYQKGDKNFEDTLDKIAESAVINGDEVFYNEYIKSLKDELGDFTPQN